MCENVSSNVKILRNKIKFPSMYFKLFVIRKPSETDYYPVHNCHKWDLVMEMWVSIEEL